MASSSKATSLANHHLARLGTMLERRGHRIQLTATTAGTVLIVTHKGPPAATETIVCLRNDDGTWHYMWGPDRARCFGSVARAAFAAVRIDHQLHGKLEVPR